MSNKFYTVSKEIAGRKITAQFNGISANLRAVDNSYLDGSKVTSLEKLYTHLFEHVIVDPKMKIEDFGADKIGEEKTKVIGGVEYTAKFSGIMTALRAIDKTYIDGTDKTSTEKLADYLFKNVIVTPEKLSADDFDSMEDFNAVVGFAQETMQGDNIMEEFNEIVSFANDVMSGNFRNSKDGKTTKAASK